MRRPTINDGPLNWFSSRRQRRRRGARLPEELVQARARRRARVLRVLSESDCSLNAVGLELFQARLCQRVGVAEGDVWFVRRGSGRELVQELDHAGCLSPRPTQDGGAAAYVFVLLFDLGRAAFGDEGSEVGLEG